MKNYIKKILVNLNIVRLPVILFYIFRIFPIKKNKIVFINFSGKGYGDSPKYITEQFLNNNEYDLVWLVKNVNDNNFPEKIRKIKIFSIKSIYELATAKVWINNSRFDYFVVKRFNQLYIQTWHGGLALKKIEYDAFDSLSDYYKKVMYNDNKMIDLMISNSVFCTNMYRTAFRFEGEILEIGTPRTDCLVNLSERKKIKNKMMNIYGIKDDEKVLLYVPTFRKDYEINPYDIDFDNLKRCLEDVTKLNWKVIIRLHPRINNASKYINNIDKYIDATNYGDIQELICLSDLVITDYSSTMFEAMIAQKDVIIYANDLDEYKKDRGIYLELNSLPFFIAKNNKELENIIISNADLRLSNKIDKFIKKVGLKESGKACDKILQIIENYCKQERK